MTTYKVFETVYSQPTRVDKEKGILYGCKLLGRTSLNGRTYTPKAMKEAAKLYASLGIDLDHNKTKNDRSVRDLIGLRPQNIQIKEDGVYGDVHLLLSDPQTPKLLEAAERDPCVFGFSHEADLSGDKVKGRIIVESVKKVHSLDLVRSPATTLGVFESMDTIKVTEATEEPEAEDCKTLLARAMVLAEKEGDKELALKIHKLLKPEKGEEGGTEEPAEEEGVEEEEGKKLESTQRRGMSAEDLTLLAKPYGIAESVVKILAKNLQDTPVKEVLSVFESMSAPKKGRKVPTPEQDAPVPTEEAVRELRLKKYKVS